MIVVDAMGLAQAVVSNYFIRQLEHLVSRSALGSIGSNGRL
jgi:hypothetical protein